MNLLTLHRSKVFWAVILFLAVVAGSFLVYRRTKAIDCSKIPKAENGQVIKIENDKLDPSNLNIKICDTLVFINLDDHGHSFMVGKDAVKNLEKKFDFSEFRVTKSGTYSFYDQKNTAIAGKIIVNDIK